MNQSVANNWNMENHLFPTDNQKRSMGADNELVELLWRNGQVVQQSQAQTHRKPGAVHNELGHKKKPDHPARDVDSFMNLSNLIEEDETESWIQYPLDDSLSGDFCASFFYDLANSHPIEKEKTIKHFGTSEESNVLTTNSVLKSQQHMFRQPNNISFAENSTQQDPFGRLERIENFPHFSRPIKAEIGTSNVPLRGTESGLMTGGDVGESSVMTIGSSHCGSNQMTNEADRSNAVGSTGMCGGPNKDTNRKVVPQCERGLTETLETTITSSSGGSGGSYIGTDKQSTSTQRHKRKGRDADESECQSEDAEFESAGANKIPQRSTSTRRSRAAEVHNLSERRRRDRINEKMRALQELIPHCNKSDKASMLDEAIEYLKSLQLQVQMMWMGSGMAPMMFPGVQHYMSRMSMGMGTHHSLSSIHSPMQLPRVSLVDQSMTSTRLPNHPAMCPPVLNGVNFQNAMQNPDFSQPYGRHMGFHHMQTPQSMNIFGYGPQIAQQLPKIGQPSSSGAPCHGGSPKDKTPSGKLG
ncbi:hypothetical protein AQUCO_02600376v1 [Aquilegia coerulea]|nr:hypothetical protein AQUCO_02600376v1 [Aquilegia coerulea]PIA39874.1 hypothetical protein AQUCO_02600376v1 [Aquilegia coerulea]PIA39878.1 hypothetical protein AQUCO_02600376v1 [Aquilegia coerulea]PIA39879.1 hypothetical protein AQUCO_02600376v1 [Aquilegia coerulea]